MTRQREATAGSDSGNRQRHTARGYKVFPSGRLYFCQNCSGLFTNVHVYYASVWDSNIFRHFEKCIYQE